MKDQYCVQCGHEVGSIDQQGYWRCPECGKAYNKDQYGEKVLNEFLNDINSEWDRAKDFQEYIEEEIIDIASEIESGLDSAMVTQNGLRFNSIRYRTQNFNRPGPENLVARSLLLAYGGKEEELLRDLRTQGRKLRESNSSGSSEEKILEKIIVCLNKMKESDKDNSAYNTAFTSGGAAFYRGSAKSIGIKKLPTSIVENVNAPKILNPLMQKEKEEEIEENKFRAFLAHELSHAWLDNKVDNWTTSGYWNGIDETFAYFISWEYGRSTYSGHEIGYDKDEFIQWALRIVIEKWEELEKRGMQTNPLDFARKTELRIWNKASKGRDLKHIFLRFCLYREDIERLRELEEISEIVDQDLEDIKHTLIDFSQNTENQQLGREIIDIVHSLDWKDFNQIDDSLLGRIVDSSEAPEGSESVNQHDLNWISQKIDEEINNEIKTLEEFIELQEKVEKKITNESHLERIQKDIEEMKKVENELKKINN